MMLLRSLRNENPPRHTHTHTQIKFSRNPAELKLLWSVQGCQDHRIQTFPLQSPPSKFLSFSFKLQPSGDNTAACCRRSAVWSIIHNDQSEEDTTFRVCQMNDVSVKLQKSCCVAFFRRSDVNIMDSRCRNPDAVLRLAVGVALVPVGALITFTVRRWFGFWHLV